MAANNAQQRAIVEKQIQCPKCNVQLAGITIMHTGGSGKVGQCLKCPECGYSITDCTAFDPSEHRTDGCDWSIYTKQHKDFIQTIHTSETGGV